MCALPVAKHCTVARNRLCNPTLLHAKASINIYGSSLINKKRVKLQTREERDNEYPLGDKKYVLHCSLHGLKSFRVEVALWFELEKQILAGRKIFWE